MLYDRLFGYINEIGFDASPNRMASRIKAVEGTLTTLYSIGELSYMEADLLRKALKRRKGAEE